MYVIRQPQSQTRALNLACPSSPVPLLKNTHTRWCPRVRAYRHIHPPTHTDTCAPTGMPAHGRAPLPTYPRTRTHARTHGAWSLSTSPASSAGHVAQPGFGRCRLMAGATKKLAAVSLTTRKNGVENRAKNPQIDVDFWGSGRAKNGAKIAATAVSRRR